MHIMYDFTYQKRRKAYISDLVRDLLVAYFLLDYLSFNGKELIIKGFYANGVPKKFNFLEKFYTNLKIFKENFNIN